MPARDEKTGKDARDLERALGEVGENLPDEIEGVEGSDVGRVERHARRAPEPSKR